jgi:putative CocE/NonD family hydrolase
VAQIRTFPTAALLLACSAKAGSVLPLAIAAAPEQAITEAAEMGSLAERLILSYREANLAAYLENLFHLQLAAGRFAEAEASLERLVTLRQGPDSKSARGLVPWQVYASARSRAGPAGDLASTYAAAFAEIFSKLGNKEAVELLPHFRADLTRGRTEFQRARGACVTGIVECQEGLRLVRASTSLSTANMLRTTAAPLLRAEMRRRFDVEELLVATPDGARIDTLVVRPKASAQPLTALLEFTIYADPPVSMARAAKMAAHGYVGVTSYSRGKGRSPDTPVAYRHDGDDARAVIDWIARQPWSDGRVGMYSGSYNAFTQWSAAKRLPEALKAIATNASNAPGIDTPMERNVFQNFFYPWPLYTTGGKWLEEELYQDTARWAALNRNWYMSGRPYKELPAIDGTPNPVFAEWLRHPSYDAYWQRLTPQREEFTRIDIPVLVQTGYFDGGMVGALHYLRQHYKYRPTADHRLLIGPYHHFAMQSGPFAHLSGYDVDGAALVDLQDIRLQWFDHIFRGAALPELLSDKINFQVMGAARWRHAPTLDAMGNGRLRLHLDSVAKDGLLGLRESRPTRRRTTELKVDLADRSDVDYQPPTDIFSRELDTRNALVFAAPPTAQPLEVNGSFSGWLNIVSNKKDFDLSISLYEQLPDGGYFPLASFIGRASYLRDRSRRRLLDPGRKRTLAFESDRITSRRIGAGSRIVAVVGVLKQPDMQINYGTGKDVSAESIADAGEPLRIRWANDSFIELKTWR